jgi:hypothetical protein
MKGLFDHSAAIGAESTGRRFLIYFHTFFRTMAVIMTVAAFVGAFFHILVGSLIGSEKSLWELTAMGLKNGAWYAGVWSPGLAIVGLFILGHIRNRRGQPPSSAAVDPTAPAQ